MPIESPAISWTRSLRRPIRRLLRSLAVRRRRALRTPFARLAAHFLARLIASEDAAGESEVGSGALLGLLAAPGAFMCLILLEKYSTLLGWLYGRVHEDLYATSAPDKFLFISAAMAVTGIVTVLKWDRILPDAQDYLNLAPLPLRPHAVLLANTVAIAFAVIVFVVDVNAFSIILFPLIVGGAAQATVVGFAQFVAIHAVCLILSSLFAFCAVFAVFGMVAALLPRNAFRTVSPWLRGAALIGFLALLVSGFLGPQALHDATAAPSSPWRWLPSLWFTSLYQSLQHRATPALLDMARLAWQGTLIALGVVLAAYALSYRRRFAGVLEGGRRPSQQRGQFVLLRLLDLFAPRAAGFERASFRFVIRALLRNEVHRLCLAVALGLGWLLAFQTLAGAHLRPAARLPALALLEAPLVAAYLLMLGVRIALEMPAALPANWIFRIVVDFRDDETGGISRRVMHGFLAVFVLAPCLALSVWHLSVTAALVHTLYVLALSSVLVEVLPANYRKMPLGCPKPGFRHNLLMLCLLQLIGFLAFTRLGAQCERWMFNDPWRFALVPPALASAWVWNRWRLREALRNGERESGMTFENALDPAVVRLRLGDE